MPSTHKVKFREDGGRCTKNLQKFRRLPECGVFDRTILPFSPVEPPQQPPPDPKNPFHPFRMTVPGVLDDRLVPGKPERPNPVFPDESGTLIGGATGPGSQYSDPQLPQDETNVLFRGSGRVLHEQSRFGIKPTFFGPKGYRTVPTELQGGDSLVRPIQSANYRNEDADRVIQEMDDIIASRPRRVDHELENTLADAIRETGETEVDRATREAMVETDEVIPRPRRMPSSDPRDMEFVETPRPAPRRFRRPSSRSNGSRTNGSNGGSRAGSYTNGSSSTPSSETSIELTNPGTRRGLDFGQEPTLRQRRFGMRNVDLPQIPEGDVRESMSGRKRRGEYYDVEQGSPSRYRARTSRNALESRATQLSRNIALASQAAKKMRVSITESVAKRASGAVQDIRAATVRQFGQGYERVVSDSQGIRMAQMISGERAVGGGRPIDIELNTIRTNVETTDTGDITVRRPVTEDVTGLRDIDLDLSPFDQVIDEPTVIGRYAPKLAFSDRIRIARASFSEVTVRNTTAGSAAAGLGFLAGMGVAKLMGDKDYTGNRLANSSIIGGTSGAVGDVVGRTAVAIGQRTLSRSAVTAAADTAIYTTMRAGSAILRGGVEGLLIGALAAPLDLLLNDALMRSGQFTHAGANTVSSGVIGLGTTATIGAVSFAAAPETLGLSLVVGGLATLGSIIFGAVSGADQDRKVHEAKQRQKNAQIKVILTSNTRRQLLETLPAHDYDFAKALDAFRHRDLLDMRNESWDAFVSSSQRLFVDRPSNSPPPGPGSGAATGDQRRLNDLFSKYISHALINRVCTGGSDCTEIRSRDPGSLTPDEIAFLNDKTSSTWKPQAEMQVEMSVQELNYTQKRIGDAKKKMVNAWNDHQKLPSQLDPYVVETAYLDSKWEDKFRTAIKLDAQDRVIDAYASNQIKIEQLSPNIQTAAGYDDEFSNVMHAYYSDMESTAAQLEVDVPQLIELQGMEGDAQRDRYQEMQFDRVKAQPDVVKEAGDLAQEQDKVRIAGFYDIDQAYLATDPTDISQWHPSDSQILQAHAAGMNLNQYVSYMHELSLGEDGDFKRLPTYTQDELRQYGLEDRDHLYDELAMVYGKGTGPQMYDYDPVSRTFTPKQGSHLLPNHNDYVSRYTPSYLLKARAQYADMIHGLNEKNQAQVDTYNTRLLQDLQAYGDQYNDMVSSQNEYLMSHSGPVTQLLHYHVNEVFNQNRLDYHPLSESLPSKSETVVDANTISTPGRELQRTQTNEPKSRPNVTFVPGIVGSDAPLSISLL